MELFEFLEKGILKIGLFYRVKKFFKSNQTWYGVSSGSVDSETKRMVRLSFIEKILYFNPKYRLFRFF